MRCSHWVFFVGLIPGTAATLKESVTVQVYDFAHVPRSTLNAALEEAARLFRAADVHLRWALNVPLPRDWIIDLSTERSARRDQRPFYVVSILADAPAKIYPKALGFALPFAATGPHVTVFYDRILRAREGDIAAYLALGEVIAHELGHAVLQSPQHAAGGLMSATWNRSTWDLVMTGGLSFREVERRQIRQNATQRNARLPLQATRIAGHQLPPHFATMSVISSCCSPAAKD